MTGLRGNIAGEAKIFALKGHEARRDEPAAIRARSSRQMPGSRI
jgi:hypothetical protein